MSDDIQVGQLVLVDIGGGVQEVGTVEALDCTNDEGATRRVMLGYHHDSFGQSTQRRVGQQQTQQDDE